MIDLGNYTLSKTAIDEINRKLKKYKTYLTTEAAIDICNKTANIVIDNSYDGTKKEKAKVNCNIVSVKVYNDKPYIQYVEYGTGIHHEPDAHEMWGMHPKRDENQKIIGTIPYDPGQKAQHKMEKAFRIAQRSMKRIALEEIEKEHKL